MLAIAGGKGGVGKTTTALGLAAAYVRRRRRPLVVDADHGMPNCHLYADTPGERGVADVAAGRPLADAVEPARALPGVDVLAGGGVAPERYLDGLPRGRPVVVDTAAGAGADVGAALVAADGVVVVTTADEEAVVDALKSAALARALGTPVVASVVVGTSDDTDGIAAALDAPVTAVPRSRAPLRNTGVAAAYDNLATATGPNP
ncbi:AAA family ATPase [Halarchaeum sp. CBA1220]|uniref:MinD/ParA family ATP-binding protein n=1 Tax=Halarchaeum sp. CBA1220 TaxID=1853682 RepID=UPI001314C99D|nr:AAA family ATPase [Halarchaeum sp. CBA1220]QLC32659.1 AAA family ATPase [Halarchaeum sp. CBA1220]